MQLHWKYLFGIGSGTRIRGYIKEAQDKNPGALIQLLEISVYANPLQRKHSVQSLHKQWTQVFLVALTLLFLSSFILLFHFILCDSYVVAVLVGVVTYLLFILTNFPINN